MVILKLLFSLINDKYKLILILVSNNFSFENNSNN